MFIVIALDHSFSFDKKYQTIQDETSISVPIVFNSYQEAKEWTKSVKVPMRQYLISENWNPRSAA